MKKSKILTFLLSFFPGLGHAYLGMGVRGLSLMICFFGLIVAIVVMMQITYSDFPLIFVPIVPVIWFYGLFDALTIWKKMMMNEEVEDRMPLMDLKESLVAQKDNKLWAMFFALIPGAGHMYLGWQNKGLQFMLMFFLALFLMSWLHLSLFLFILPIIWFYSFFDVLHLVSQHRLPGKEKSVFSWLAEKQHWVGFSLILVGVLIFFDKLLVNYLGYKAVDLIKTSIVAVLLIGGGLRLVMGNKITVPGDTDPVYEEELLDEPAMEKDVEVNKEHGGDK